MESMDQLAKKTMALKPNPDIEVSWIAEAEARFEAYKRGELGVIDWDEIRKRYEHCGKTARSKN